VKRTRWKAVATVLGFALAALAGACGSGDDDNATTTVQQPPVSATTADRLAKLSNRVAENLDAGLTCDAAHAADDLSAAVEESDLPANLRPGVETVATDLVNQVNCPPPPPPPEPEKKPKKDEDDDQGDGDDRGNGDENGGGDEGGGDGDGRGGDGKPGRGQSNEGGFVPPGKAKLKGEDG
jgi:hypothetical protein